MREITNFLITIYSRLTYIIESKEVFKINLVIGNASCDLDSVCSSFLFSFMRNYECGLLSSLSENKIAYNIKDKENEIYIPVINCPKGELFWRLDINQLLSKMGIKENELFYFQDVFDINKKLIHFEALGKKS